MSKARTSKAELAAALAVTPSDIDHLVEAGILPSRGRRGWCLAECRQRMDLASSASRFASAPAWLEFLDEFERLARKASAALTRALAEPSPATALAAADAGNRYFAAWAFCIAVLGDRPNFPASMNATTHAIVLDNFAAGLAAVGQTLDARAAVKFLN